MQAFEFDFTGWTADEARALCALLVDVDGVVLEMQILTDWPDEYCRQTFLRAMQHTSGDRRAVAERVVRSLLDRPPVDARGGRV